MPQLEQREGDDHNNDNNEDNKGPPTTANANPLFLPTASDLMVSTENIADLPDYIQTPADAKLDNVYGDHPHANNRSHLYDGVMDDTNWQRWWRSVVELP